MRTRITTYAATIIATVSIATNAIAVYTGLQVTSQSVTLQNGTIMTQFRVYASFSDPFDYLKTVSGSPTLGNLVIQSRNSDQTGFGSTFFNPLGGEATAPTLDAISQNPDIEHDTFVTIGVSIAEQGSAGPPKPDETKLAAGFAGIGNVNQINSNNAGWLVPGPLEQGRAGYLGDGDPLLRVLMMQLTVSSTSTVRGTVAIGTTENIPLAGLQNYLHTGQTFNSIPAPGALPLLGLAAFIGRRRRRSSASMDTPHSPTQDNHS